MRLKPCIRAVYIRKQILIAIVHWPIRSRSTMYASGEVSLTQQLPFDMHALLLRNFFASGHARKDDAPFSGKDVEDVAAADAALQPGLGRAWCDRLQLACRPADMVICRNHASSPMMLQRLLVLRCTGVLRRVSRLTVNQMLRLRVSTAQVPQFYSLFRR
jgi:hypothetical protein